MMGHARLWKPVLPFLMDEGAARAFGGLRGSRRGFSDDGVFCPLCRNGGHDVNRTLYKFCENTSVLIFYSPKAHVPPGHASSLGRGSGENMALGLRKLFLSDPGGRLRARYEQIGFARARITVVAAIDPNHAYLQKPPANSFHQQVTSPVPRASIPHHPRWWEPSQAYELQPISTIYFHATHGQHEDPKEAVAVL